MKAKQLVPLAFAAGALITLAVTVIRTGITPGDNENVLAGSGHGVTATYVTPQAPKMLIGQSAGEEPAPVVTTTTAPGH